LVTRPRAEKYGQALPAPAKSLLTISRKDVEKMVDKAREDILSGCVVDFPERLRVVARPYRAMGEFR